MVRDISDRKRAERALKASEQRFRRLFESIPNVAVQGYDRQCRVIYWNNASELFYGYAKAEAIGQRLEALIIPPEMRQQVAEDVQHWLDGGQPIPSGEMSLMHKDGSRVAVFSSHMLLDNTEGETELYCVDVDLRPLKQAEMTLQNLVEGTAATIGHEFFPALVRHIAEALAVDYVLVTEKVEDELQTLAFWANGTLQPTYQYRLTSTPCEQVIKRGYFYVQHSVQQAFPDAEDVDLGAMEAESYLGVALRNNQGKVIGNLCILHHQPIRDADRAEQILRVFAARAAAELERQCALTALEELNQRLEIQVAERTVELREREARYRALVEVMPDLLIRLHADGTYLDVIVGSDVTLLNPEHSRVGNNIYEVISLEHAQQRMFYVQRALQTQEVQLYEYELVIEGKTHWEDARIIAINHEEVLVIVRDITERKQAEDALQESEQFIQTVLDTIPLPVFWKDRNSAFTGCNQWFAEAMGVQSAAELVGDTDFNFVTTQSNAERYRADDRWVMTTGRAKLGIEETIFTANGEQRWIETHKAPLRDSANNVVGVVGTFQDVTERKHTETAMKRQLAAIEAAIDGIGILQDGKYIYVNQAHVNLFGYDSPAELVGQTWNALHSIDEARRFDQAVLPILNQAKSWQGETVATRKDGSTFTEGLSMTLTEDQLVICVCRDVSDRKYAEAALRSSENRYRAIFNQVAVGIKQVDSSGQFISANRAFCEMLGYTKTEVLQLNDHTITHPDDLAKHQLMYEQLKEVHLPLFLGEKRYRHKAGHYVWTEVAISTLRDQNNQLLSYLAVVVNIDNRKEAEQELLKAKEAAEAADRAKSAFLANMSHELRTPLNAILGFTQLILHEKQLDAETHEHLDIVNRSGKHLLTIINDVLQMSKIEAGKVSFTPRNFDLYALLWSLEGMFSLKAQTKELQLVIAYHPDVPRYVEADEGKLRQILTNLLSNAVKFTLKGRIVLRVRALASEGSTSVDTKFPHSPSITLLFEVEDTGPGIAPEELALLFKPFMQTEAGQLSQEGTGLGLTISQHFAQVMGSEIQLATTLGQGTTFFFELDVLRAPYPSEVASDRECRTVKHIKPAPTSHRLLVVEDNRINRLLLVRLLENAGFEVQSVENGEAAVERAQSWKPHLIWMDIHMPIMDGYEATRQIKSAGLTPCPIILALTASVFESDKQRILSAGCDDFLGKPFQSHQIFQKIAQYLPIDYVYSKEAADPKLPSDSSQEDVSLEAKSATDSLNLALPAMPKTWFKSLHQAAVRGSDDQVIELARTLPPEESALMHALEIWVEGFRFDAILEWLQNQSNGDSW
ncbi:MAG: PAS domain S-box protein, partial [Cyanobacteria bacterium P01_H01_bin.58]